MKLRNKTALVLGASRGIGRTIAKSLARKGVRLVLPWFDWPEDSRKMEEEFTAMNKDHLIIRANLCSPKDIQFLVDKLDSNFGKLHILINNIERGGMPVVHGSYDRYVNREQWHLELDTTLRAKWLVFERCLPLMKRCSQAAVINISSIAGLIGRSGPAGLLFNDGYSAANRSISILTKTWARLGAPNVRVNEIMLGLIDTRHGADTKGWKALSDKQKRQLLDHTLLGRTGKPKEVADTVMFLLRNADFMTGSVIRLDGGYILGGENVPPMPEGII